jgi:hypothetical protein
MVIILCLTLCAFTAAGLVREWRAPLDSRFFRVPGLWPWSEKAWLGVKAGDAVGPAWFLTGALYTVASGLLADILLGLLTFETLLLTTLLFLGTPTFLMPPALRGRFRGGLRTMEDSDSTAQQEVG